MLLKKSSATKNSQMRTGYESGLILTERISKSMGGCM